MLLLRSVLIVVVAVIPLGLVEWALFRYLDSVFPHSYLIAGQVIASVVGCGVIAFAGIAEIGAKRLFRRGDTPEARVAAEDLHDNIFVVACAGALLLFPGMVSDFLAIALLTPPVRGRAANLFARFSRPLSA